MPSSGTWPPSNYTREGPAILGLTHSQRQRSFFTKEQTSGGVSPQEGTPREHVECSAQSWQLRVRQQCPSLQTQARLPAVSGKPHMQKHKEHFSIHLDMSPQSTHVRMHTHTHT